MITASITARLAFDAREFTTKKGTPMTTCRVACDADGETIWMDVVGFGSNAERMARLIKGDRISAMGLIRLHKWQTKDGEDRETMQLVADSLLTAGTAKGASAKPKQKAQPVPRQPASFSDPFACDTGGEDDIPF